MKYDAARKASDYTGPPTGDVARKIGKIVENVGKVARKMLHNLNGPIDKQLDPNDWPPVRPVFGSLARALVVNSFSVLKDDGEEDVATALQLESTWVRLYMETTAKRVELLLWRMVQQLGPDGSTGTDGGGTLVSIERWNADTRCGTTSPSGVRVWISAKTHARAPRSLHVVRSTSSPSAFAPFERLAFVVVFF